MVVPTCAHQRSHVPFLQEQESHLWHHDQIPVGALDFWLPKLSSQFQLYPVFSLSIQHCCVMDLQAFKWPLDSTPDVTATKKCSNLQLFYTTISKAHCCPLSWKVLDICNTVINQAIIMTDVFITGKKKAKKVIKTSKAAKWRQLICLLRIVGQTKQKCASKVSLLTSVELELFQIFSARLSME